MSKASFLDSNFFDSKSKLKPDVREVLMMIYDDILSDFKSKELEIDIEPSFLVLTGSLCGGDWDEFSDIDLHVGIDFSKFDEDTLVREYLREYSKVFNDDGYDLLGRHVELYFQDVEEKHVSPGVYDVINNMWIIMPSKVHAYIPEAVNLTSSKLLKVVLNMVDEYDKLEKNRGSVSVFYTKVKSLWDRIKNIRKDSIAKEGLNGFGNLVFKKLRRNGALNTLSGLMHRAKVDIYEIWNKRYSSSN